MFKLILDSGLHNATFWLLLLGTVALALNWQLRERRIASTLFMLMLIVGTGANLFLSLYRAYSVPRDVMQDIVSAKEYIDGRPLYPPDMTRRIRLALEEEGPRASLLEAWPSLRQREREQLDDMLNSHWVQAHPPFMTIFIVPLVRDFGVLGTQMAMILISLIALAVTLSLLRLELFPQLGARPFAILCLMVLGWDPVLTALRSGQTGLLLGGLLTVSWFLLRRGRPGWAGVAAGVAISLKLIPGIILLVFVMRHRRAFYSTMLTVLSIGLFVLGLTSIRDHLDYVNTSRGVVEMYAAYSGNLSLLGSLARSLRDLEMPFAVTRAVWLVSGGLMALAFAWQLCRRPEPAQEKEQIDLQFTLAMTLIPMLSPVAWDHYLIYLILPLTVLGGRIQATGHRGLSVGFAGLLLLFALPDALFHLALATCAAHGMSWLAIWLILDLRLFGLCILTIWSSRAMYQALRKQKPMTAMQGAIIPHQNNPCLPPSSVVGQEQTSPAA
ncbi:glycosyltransferase family 87 protein [Zavarzinella formosa]|uniref:glycosyltransferase family 87 protein n=1 Tax=Zavarzinella formosa TaxID=360055 RepID=UPI0002D6380A|nr:glycosyltransferase family 87 protein [Zavarzinella formosa]